MVKKKKNKIMEVFFKNWWTIPIICLLIFTIIFNVSSKTVIINPFVNSLIIFIFGSLFLIYIPIYFFKRVNIFFKVIFALFIIFVLLIGGMFSFLSIQPVLKHRIINVSDKVDCVKCSIATGYNFENAFKFVSQRECFGAYNKRNIKNRFPNCGDICIRQPDSTYVYVCSK